MESWKIDEKYVEDHPIFEEMCSVCDEKFKVGDEIVLIPIQRSKSHQSFNAVALPIHINCYWVD